MTRQIQEHGGKVLTGHRVTGARLHDGGGGAQRWALHGELLTNSSNCSVDLGSFAALVLADSSCLLPGNGDGGLVLEGVPEVASARRRAQQLEHLPSFALMVAHPHSLRTSFDAGYVKNNSWFSWVSGVKCIGGRMGGAG